MTTVITELDELGAEKVSGVGSPANDTPWLLLKAAEDGVDNDDPDAGQTESSEADAIEDELTKAQEAICLLHDYARFGVEEQGVAAVKTLLDSFAPEVVEKAKMKAKERNALPDKTFAYIDSKGGRHLPINDEAHVRNALARFDQTHFESEGAKTKAAAKIRAKAKAMGIHVSDDDNAAKGSPGVPDFATETPKEHGHLAHSGESGVAGPATDGTRHPHADPSYALGGESSYVIPDETRAYGSEPNPGVPERLNREGGEEAAKGWSIEVVDGALKDGNWLALDDLDAPSPQESTEPGDAAWETYDASTLDSVARGLAAASRAVTEIAQREATEAIHGNAADWFDAFDLGCAAEDIDQALGLVARLAYHEAAAENGAKKAGRRHSAKDEAMLRAARDHLNELLGEHHADTGADTSEEDEIMTTVTKEELASTIAEASKQGFLEALKAQRKQAKKAEKKAKKNANNGGDITAADEERAVRGHADANDVNAISGAGHVDGQYVNKSEKKDKALKAMADQLSEMRELVEKMAKRPRSGGPVLDGQARGSFPAAEGRMSEQVTKSEGDEKVERLAKQLGEEKDPLMRDQISRELTLARLVQGHMNGQI